MVISLLRKFLHKDAEQPRPFQPDYRWRCECGAKARQSDSQSDTKINAERHQWAKGVGHPMPEVYPVDGA